MQKFVSLNILKGYACFIVFLAHFFDCFYWYSGLECKESTIIVSKIGEFPFYFFICGGFMVNVFCVLSGFFATNKKISSIKELIVIIVKRYMRFFLPILISNIILFVISKLNMVPYEVLKNDLLSSSLDACRMDNYNFLYHSILLESQNGALWMIKPLFIGNVLIYIYQYMKDKLNNKYIKLIVFFLLYVGCFLGNDIMWMTINGFIFKYVISLYKKENNFIDIVLVVSTIAWVSGLKIPILYRIPEILKWILNDKTLSVFWAIVLCVAARSLKQTKISNYLAKNSFSIFVLHIPIIYTIGLISFHYCFEIFSYEVAFGLTLGISTIILIFIAKIYTLTIDKYCNKLIAKVWSKIYVKK